MGVSSSSPLFKFCFNGNFLINFWTPISPDFCENKIKLWTPSLSLCENVIFFPSSIPDGDPNSCILLLLGSFGSFDSLRTKYAPGTNPIRASPSELE